MENFLNFIKHPITISILVLVIGVLGIWGLIQSVPKSTVEKGPMLEHTWGKQDSDVVLEVYADFQCPGCKYFWENVETELRTNYGDKIKFIYHPYPLSIHIKADNAAQAAEAAGEQGKYFEYADVLYKNQPDQSNLGAWTDDVLISYAKDANLDVDKFKESYKSGKYKEVVKDYIKQGDARGVNSTPTVFLNNEEIRGPNNTIADYATLSSKIDDLLKQTPSTTPSATSTKQAS